MEGEMVSIGKTPGARGDWTTNQREYTEGHMAQAACVAKDGLGGSNVKRGPWA